MKLPVNGIAHEYDGDEGRWLLDYLRRDLGILSPKDGCLPQAACGCCAVGLNACCDYDTHLAAGAVLANGSATRQGQRIPADCIAQGVPAEVVKENITDEDRAALFGLIPSVWTATHARDHEKRVREANG